MRLLIGEYSHKLMNLPHKFLSYPYHHMHNFLAQVLMLTGLPGFLLVFCFAILLAVKMIRFIFVVHPNATVEAKTLTLPLAGIFVYGMFETVIFTSSADHGAPTDIRELYFFFVAGIFLRHYYQIFPTKKNK